MKDIWGKYKVWIIAAVVLIIVLVVVYKIGEGDAYDNMPDKGQGIPAGWGPEQMATRLSKGVKGVNFFCYDSNGDMFRDLAELTTDDMFVAVTNYYKDKFASGSNTLRSDLQGETPCGISPDAKYWKKEVMKRFDKLNIS